MKHSLLLSFPLFFCLLVGSVFAVSSDARFKNHSLYVGEVVHPLFIDRPYFEKGIVDSLGVVDLVMLPIRLLGNTSANVTSALAELETYLVAYTNYDVGLQTYFLGFGYNTTETVYLEQYNLTILSQAFYDEYFCALANLTQQYPNVVLYLGFNEPMLHFPLADIPVLLEMEYRTFKAYMPNIKFSVKFFVPFEWWRDRISFLKDCGWSYSTLKGFWAVYSDYVGVTFWLPEAKTPPANPPCDDLTAADVDLGNIRTLAYDAWGWLKVFSSELGKPICLAEFPIQYSDIYVTLIAEGAMTKPNVGIHYCLMSSDAVSGGYDDCLFGLNVTSKAFWKVEPTYKDFIEAVTLDYDDSSVGVYWYQEPKKVLSMSVVVVFGVFVFVWFSKRRF